MKATDILIIGSGIAGLTLALKLNRRFPERKIIIITKGNEMDSNTSFAQGGIAAVCDSINDSFEKHVEDTLAAGDGLCDVEIVEKVIRHAPKALSELLKFGVDFDYDVDGSIALGIEGGHSQPRIVHYKDITGHKIASSLLNKVRTIPAVTFLTQHVAIDLITEKHVHGSAVDDNKCIGAFVLDKSTSKIEYYASEFTILATGGIGQLFQVTTNPSVATGDGVAMAFRAGAEIADMEFIQFHPTAFYHPENVGRQFLITEALRGFGAYLRNHHGVRFMSEYDDRAELACRDVVARAIEEEIKKSGHPCVYLDCTHLPAEELLNQFPTVYEHCLTMGIDITTTLIPVSPAAHYLCGGIKVNVQGQSSIKHLYAIGECARTGLHGANRLASNSLLEAMAFADFCYQDITPRTPITLEMKNEPDIISPYEVIHHDYEVFTMLFKTIQKLMTRTASVTRSTNKLHDALQTIVQIENDINVYYSNKTSAQLIVLKNILTCSKLVIEHSLRRTENKGVFYNEDLK